jgi:hypothetical protein
MNEEVAYQKILRCATNALVIDLGTYLDKVQYKWFSQIKYL